jgi:hypothetical protein
LTLVRGSVRRIGAESATLHEQACAALRLMEADPAKSAVLARTIAEQALRGDVPAAPHYVY